MGAVLGSRMLWTRGFIPPLRVGTHWGVGLGCRIEGGSVGMGVHWDWDASVLRVGMGVRWGWDRGSE